MKTIYSYEVSGYQVQDTRLFCAMNGKTYMFGAKGISELSWYASEALTEAAGSFWYLAAGTVIMHSMWMQAAQPAKGLPRP